jgi:type VI secretion system secreted protein Hcp
MKPINAGRARKAMQVVFAAGVAAGAVQADAAVDSWLKIPGLPGESLQQDHKGEIDVISFAQMLDAKNCSYAFVKNLDKASPGLADAVARKSVLPTVTLTSRKSGEGQKDFYVLTLFSVAVQSLELSWSAGGVAQAEQIVLSPRSVNISYKPQDEKGGLGPEVKASFNCDK